MKGYRNRELPCSTCGGKCCYFAPIETKVWERVKHKAVGAAIEIVYQGTPKEAALAIKPDTEGECWFLKDGKCSIYSMRPRSCRSFLAERNK